MNSITVNEINTDELGHCVRIVSDETEIIVTIDYGPRIVSVSEYGRSNPIYHSRDTVCNRCYGHKMKITVDKPTNEMYLDDLPVIYSALEDGVHFAQTVTEPVPMELSMDIVFTSEIGSFMVVHSVTNKSDDALKLAIYTETPLMFDGFVFVPLSNITEDGRPSRILNIWNNARWNDPRLFIGDNYMTLVGDSSLPRFKIASNNTAGWCGFVNSQGGLIKHYVHNRHALYPFSQCSAYAVAKQHYLSLQTSSPFFRIEPSAAARHVESWILTPTSQVLSPKDEKGLDNFVNSI